MRPGQATEQSRNHRLSSDDNLASGGNSQCFGASGVAAGYTGYPGQNFLFHMPVIVYSPISNLLMQNASELKVINFFYYTGRTFLHTNISTFCRCFRSRQHFSQCDLPLSLPTQTVYLHGNQNVSGTKILSFAYRYLHSYAEISHQVSALCLGDI